MNLLIVNYEYPPLGGGAANASRHIADNLVALGHQATVLTSGYRDLKGKRSEKGVCVYRLPVPRRAVEKSDTIEMALYGCAALCNVSRLVERKKIQGAIVFFSFPCGPVGLFARMVRGIPYVVSLRGGEVPGAEPSLRPIHFLLAPLRKTIFANALAVVCPSHGLKKLAQETDPVPMTVIPNGVDAEFFRQGNRQAESKNSAPSFLFVGRFQDQKNLPFTIKQFSRFQRSYGKDFSLHMVGDGPLKNELVELAAKSGILDRIRWHGWLDKEKLLRVYRDSDCLVNFSKYEGMSNVSLEAMACGLPVIAGNVPGNADLIIDGKTGFLVELETERIQTALHGIAEDKALRTRMGAAGRNRVETRFSWRTASMDYLRLFSG